MNYTEEQWEERMKDYRKEHFTVEVKPSKYQIDEAVLSIATNGHQWMSISLTHEEMRLVAKTIQQFFL